jgi:hypothetical protein
MKRPYARTLWVLGISLLTTATIQAQDLTAVRAIDKQVSAAKSHGLFRQTVTPFELQQYAARPATAAAVTDATYLQLPAAGCEQLFREHPEAMTMSIPVNNGSPLELELVQQSPFDKDFFVSTNTSEGKAVAYTPGIYYRGVIKGKPGSTVALSVFSNEIIGVAATREEGNLVLGKLEVPGNESGYILYSDKNLKAPQLPGCSTEEPLGYTERIREYMQGEQKATADKCVRVYLECDYALHQNKGGVAGATNFITAVFNNLAVLYANEQITTVISQVYVWTTQDSYPTASSSSALNSFRTTRPAFNGDLAHLAALGGANVGGIAWVDVLCNNSYRYAYSNIYSSYNTVPTYSWSVYVMTHEMGHNLGSPHTQSCSWSGGALDNCYTTEGGCAQGPAPANGGTIMSYCHLTSYGINFNNGFGTQPGNLIRSRVNNASCLTACNPGGCSTNSATLTIVVDNYPAEITWNIKNSAAQVVASGGSYSGTPSGTAVNIPLCLPNGCYTLTMLDAYGDGICCAYGNGSYTLKNNANNVVLASGGQYTSQDVKTFCFTAGAQPQAQVPQSGQLIQEDRSAFKVYPNPASDVLHMDWYSDNTAAASIVVKDITGRVVIRKEANSQKGSNRIDIPVGSLSGGMYLLQLSNGDRQHQQKVMIRK